MVRTESYLPLMGFCSVDVQGLASFVRTPGGKEHPHQVHSYDRRFIFLWKGDGPCSSRDTSIVLLFDNRTASVPVDSARIPLNNLYCERPSTRLSKVSPDL